MSSQLPLLKVLFISFTFFRSSTLVRTVTWIEPLCFRLGRDLAGFSGPFSTRALICFASVSERKRDGLKTQMT